MILKVNQKTLEVEIKNNLDQLLEKLGMSDDTSQEIKEVHSPMPGMILDIIVKAGQKVSKGEPLLILEAMKMENIIKSPKDSVLKHINVSKGQNVNRGDILIIFD